MNGAAAAADSAESLCAMLLLKGVMEVALCRPARIEATNQCHTQGVGPGGGGDQCPNVYWEMRGKARWAGQRYTVRS